MTRRRKILICVACALVAVVTICFFSLRDDEKQPIYNGRTLGEWLDHCGVSDEPSEITEAEAMAAVRAIGVSNALPFLIKWNNTTNSTLQNCIDKLPGPIWYAIVVKGGLCAPALRKQFRAVAGFRVFNIDPYHDNLEALMTNNAPTNH